MQINSKIFVAGHTGLVGSAILKKLAKKGYNNICTKTHKDLDLTDQKAVQFFFEKEKPEYVFLAAAKVGGIIANSTYPAEFIYENILIQSNIINSSYKTKVKRLLFLGSSCIYPKITQQPIKEEYLLTGALEPTNAPYAVAKISGIHMCWAYNRQYGTDFIPVMPTNLYGENDNFNTDTAHVIPALIRKFHEAKISSSKSVTVWGTGKPKREFLHVDDLAEACIFVICQKKTDNNASLLNIGSGLEISIHELAMMIKKITKFKGKIVFDTTKPDGTLQKFLDSSKINSLGWRSKIPLKMGLEQTYNWYIKTLNN